ncbi:MAG: chemotaxis protein CheA [Pseudomonadota bacterium]
MEADIHRQTFLEEARELLAELETSILAWEANPADSSIIDRVFRAMHTIKGSGAMFGFEELSGFTHQVETVLDAVRRNMTPPGSRLVDLILEARDQIKVMLEASEGGPPADETVTRGLEAALLEFSRPPGRAGEAAPEPKTEADPVLPESSRADFKKRKTFRIRFRPHENIFRMGTNPLLLLNELRGLGAARVIVHTDAVPPLEAYDPEACYFYWDIFLVTDQGLNAARDVFIFVEDDCTLRIDELDEEVEAETSPGPGKRLGDILVDRGDVDRGKLENVLTAKPPIGEMLVDAGLVSPGQVRTALLEQRHIRDAAERRRMVVESQSIRVNSVKLDKLVNLAGEMVTVQARLSQAAAARRDPALISISEEVERLTAEFRDGAMSVRTVPIGMIFNKFKRLVRDLSHELGKEVEMETHGEETELDKNIIDRLNEPMVHLIRNCLDHGFEPPDVRSAAGKPRSGLLRISARHSGAFVLVQVRDDGAGLNVQAITNKALSLGLIGPDSDLTEAEVFNLVFTPGFSTSGRVTGVSGRGVGMDVVKKNIEALKGTIEIQSKRGLGTEITLKLPLTLAIIDGLLVVIGTEFFVIPLAVIEECVELAAKERRQAKGRRTVTVRGEMTPYIRLRERFGINENPPELEQIVIGRVGGQRIGFVVDRVIGDHQTVIKSLGPFFRQVTDVSGATILGDGTVALILDVHKLVQAVESEQREVTLSRPVDFRSAS